MFYPKQQNKCLVFGSKKDLDIEYRSLTTENTMFVEESELQDQNKRQLVKKRIQEFLTLSFEKEIFIFVEEVLDYIENLSTLTFTEEERRQLHYINLGVRSLLRRKLPEHGLLSRCNKKEEKQTQRAKLLSTIAKEAPKLKDLGVEGCCFMLERLVIFCKNPNNEHSIREYISTIGIECFEPISIQGCSIRKVINVSRGDKICAEETGTLGAFARSCETKELVAVTAGHVCKQNESVFLPENAYLGVCEKSIFEEKAGNIIDIALITIDKSAEMNCSTVFRDEREKECRVCVSRGNGKDDLLTVHKRGSTTNWTTGIVLSEECAENFGINGIVIGCDDDTHFAKKGDSGSVVFHYDETDLDNNQIELIGIVSSIIQVSGTRPIEVPPFLTIASKVKLCLDEVGKMYEWDRP